MRYKNNKKNKNKRKNKNKNNRKDKKGQYFAFDAVTAVIIFLVTLSLIVSYWFNIQSIMNAQDSEAYRTAIRISDTLVSKGNPTINAVGGDWVKKVFEGYFDEVYIAGLGENSSLPVLDMRYIIGYPSTYKLHSIGSALDGSLDDKRYNNLKRALGTGYDFEIRLYEEGSFNGGLGSPLFHLGMDNYTNANTTVASFTRVVTLHYLSGSVDEYKRGNLQVNVWAE